MRITGESSGDGGPTNGDHQLNYLRTSKDPQESQSQDSLLRGDKSFDLHSQMPLDHIQAHVCERWSSKQLRIRAAPE